MHKVNSRGQSSDLYWHTVLVCLIIETPCALGVRMGAALARSKEDVIRMGPAAGLCAEIGGCPH